MARGLKSILFRKSFLAMLIREAVDIGIKKELVFLIIVSIDPTSNLPI